MKKRTIALLTCSTLFSSVLLSGCGSKVTTPPEETTIRCDIVSHSVYEAIDQHALNTPAQAEKSLQTLAAYLVKPAKNDREKARAIYRWVTHNIAYNDEEYFAGEHRMIDSDDLLKNRRAVCDGYSGLVKTLGEAAGLEVENISGYSKGYSYSVHQTDTINHAWNAIKIDGEWQLIDTTWGAGYLDNKEQRFVRQFEDYYFLTPPEQFISDHFPKESKWQLLESRLAKSDYDQRVYLRPAFFKNGLEIDSHQQGLIHTDNKIAVTLQVPADVFLLARVLQGGNKLDSSYTSILQKQAAQSEIHATFPGAGEYTLRIYAKPKQLAEKCTYRWALDYKIKASQGKSCLPVLPKQAFIDAGLKADSHPCRLIETEKQVMVTIGAPKDVLMSAKVYKDNNRLDKTLTFVQKKAGQYEIQAVFPNAGEYILRLFAKRQDGTTGNYEHALDYQLKVSQGESGKIGFPAIFAPFKEKAAYLYKPMHRYLTAGTTQIFKLAVPGAEKVTVFVGDTRFHLQKQGELFEGEVTIDKGNVDVLAKFAGDTRFASLLKYMGE